MSPQQQLAQSVHVSFEFAHQHLNETVQWMKESNTIVILNVESEIELYKLVQEAERKEIKYSIFREPDLVNQLTAIALEPSPKTKKLCKNLKLALSSNVV